MADLLKFPDIRTLAWKSTKAQNGTLKSNVLAVVEYEP